MRSGDLNRRYANYRANRQQVTPIVMMIVIGFISKVFTVAILVTIVVGVVFILSIFISGIRNRESNNKTTEEAAHGSKGEKQIERRVNTMELKSTEAGYVNKNNQKNFGKTNKPGTDNNQWFYEMECLDCGHKYYANGSDIWLRKCPRCQGGRP